MARCFVSAVDMYENNTYKCTGVSDEACIRFPDHGWIECGVQVSGNIYPGYSYTSASGRQYYIWWLEPARRPTKKKK